MDERTDAQVLVVQDPAELGQSNSWSAALLGQLVIDQPYFLHNGAKGVCVKYKSAVAASKRSLWISAAFSGERPEITRLIEDVVASAGSRWRLIGGSVEDYLTTKARALGTVREKQTAALKRRSKAVSMDKFISSATHLDPVASKSGLCGF